MLSRREFFVAALGLAITPKLIEAITTEPEIECYWSLEVEEDMIAHLKAYPLSAFDFKHIYSPYHPLVVNQIGHMV